MRDLSSAVFLVGVAHLMCPLPGKTVLFIRNHIPTDLVSFAIYGVAYSFYFGNGKDVNTEINPNTDKILMRFQTGS